MRRNPMLPYMAQGRGANRFEDAACWRSVSNWGPDSHDPGAALNRYEQTPQPRASRCQEGSRRNGIMYHLPDGEDQRERDAQPRVGTTAPLPQNAWLTATTSRQNSSEAEIAREGRNFTTGATPSRGLNCFSRRPLGEFFSGGGIGIPETYQQEK